MKKEMLINVLQPEECRIAIVEDGILEELYVERTSHESYTGNIYKGKIVNLEPAIQAAFVDFSVGRNGFLHVSDVEPQYYRRLLPEDAELGARDRGRDPRTSGRERDRDEPRPRERDRDRDEPRGDGGARKDYLQLEDRTGEREPEREREREPGERGGRRGRDRDRDNDRADRSEKGRRDRSESRPFGEGLVDEDWLRPSPPPRPAVPPPRPPAESRRDRAPEREREREPERGREEPRRGRTEPEPAPRGRVDEPATSWPIPEPEAEAPRERFGFGRGVESEPIGFEADLPPSRTARRQPEPVSFEEDLPPSRTARRQPEPAEPEAELPPSRTARRTPTARTPEPEPREDLAEPEARAAEPRRGRRGRSQRPASAPEPEPVPEFEPIEEVVEEPVDLGPADDDLPEAPRRRGGRAAIRSRGGEREPGRPRPLPPAPPAEPERPRERDRERPAPRPAAAERPFGEELVEERPRPVTPAEPERPRGRGRDRDRIRPEAEPPRERLQPHDRAGEPGYVPRRERSPRPTDPEAELPPFDWADVPAPRDDDFGRGALDLEPEADVEAAGEDEAGERGEGGRRRRRRRRRRGDRPEREAEAEAGAEDVLDREPEEEDEDEDVEFSPRPAATARGRRDPDRGPSRPELIDDLDFEGEAEGFVDEDEFAHEADIEAVAAPEEEIDPELQEEIRREIEEIAELEREMGLRGPVEARPRRGEAEAEPEPTARGPRPPRGRGVSKPPIQEVFRRGDEVLIQVIKESIGTKGPTLSTYISIPGRYLVLMPGLNRVGVSRKIADEGQRRKLRAIMNDLNPPKGLGFIVRTAGLDRSKRELARDLAYLLRLWKVILRRIKKAKAPAPIYQESDMITRTIRDIFNAEIDTIWIDEPAAFERAQEFLRVVMPKFVNRLKFYDDKVPLFHKYGIEEEIAKIQRRRVEMPEGGSIVIDQTEALVAIDVNSGNFRVENDAERTAYEMNLRAAKEIARQLRLRDLGGVICNDFIDMRDEKHRRGVERALRDAIKRDRARTKVLRMSQFGVIEMTRQRIRPSLKRSVYEDCKHCGGSGVVKTAESMSIDVMRLLALAGNRDDVRQINVTVCSAVATYLNNRKRQEIARLEADSNLTVQIRHEHDVPAEHLHIECYDAQNGEVRLLPSPAPTHHHHHHRRGR